MSCQWRHFSSPPQSSVAPCHPASRTTPRQAGDLRDPFHAHLTLEPPSVVPATGRVAGELVRGTADGAIAHAQWGLTRKAQGGRSPPRGGSQTAAKLVKG